MPQFLQAKGKPFLAYTREEVIAAGGRDDDPRWERSPTWAEEQFDLPEPLYIFLATPVTPRWEAWREDTVSMVPVGFYEIWTNNLGELTGEEYRREVADAGLRGNSSMGVRIYRDRLAQDMALFGGLLSTDDVLNHVNAEMRNDWRRAHTWASEVLQAEPLYFLFKAYEVESFFLPPVRFEAPPEVVVRVSRENFYPCVAFPGRHALIRHKFSPGIGRSWPDNIPPYMLPGRDIPSRLIGTDALGHFMLNPAYVLERIQLKQLQQGRPVTMPRSPRIPPHAEWGVRR